MTLQELYDALEDAKAGRHVDAGPVPEQAALPKVFTYFDCTDYVDQDDAASRRGRCSLSRNGANA